MLKGFIHDYVGERTHQDNQGVHKLCQMNLHKIHRSFHCTSAITHPMNLTELVPLDPTNQALFEIWKLDTMDHRAEI